MKINLNGLGLGIGLGLAIHATVGMGTSTTANKEKVNSQSWGIKKLPNIILIFTDDQGYNDLGCFNSPNIKTPNIDRMATQGAKFTSFYSAANVCSPSRMALLTGSYPARVGMTEISDVFWGGEKTGINPAEITMPELLKQKDYATICIGKWHIGGHHDLFNPINHGFDEYYGILQSNDMNSNIYRGTKLVEPNADQGMLTRKFTDEALSFIDKNKAKPFFIYLPYTAPHKPIVPHKDFKGKSAAGPYGDVVEELDAAVGEIIHKLETLKLSKKTLIVFTSDNGPDLNYKNGGSADPLSGGKFSNSEGGHREPCVMYWPGTIPAGTVTDELTTTMDLYTTFAHISGTKIPTDRVVDGKNIYPLMTAQPDAVSPYDYFLYFESWGSNDKRSYFRSIRKGKWKVSDNWGNATLYDLENDIAEKHNITRANKKLSDEMFNLYKSAEVDIMSNRRFLGNIDNPENK